MSVTITSPVLDSTFQGDVLFSATCNDLSITNVQFSIDGTIVNTDTTLPYSYIVDTTDYVNGTHNYSVKCNSSTNSTDSVTSSINNPSAQTVEVSNMANFPDQAPIIQEALMPFYYTLAIATALFIYWLAYRIVLRPFFRDKV